MKKLTQVRRDPGGQLWHEPGRRVRPHAMKRTPPRIYVPERIVLEGTSEGISRALWEVFLTWTAKIRVLDMTEDHLSPNSLRMLQKLIERYGGTVFPAVHTVINLSPRYSMGTFQLIASPGVTHVEITDRLDKGTSRLLSQSDNLLYFMRHKTPNLRLLTLHGLRSDNIDISPFQYLHEFRCHIEFLEAETWVDLSRCPLLESVWLSFGWDDWGTSSAADLQPATFPALRHLTLAAGDKEDLMVLAKISVMPLLQTAVFLAPSVSLESRSALLAQLRSTSPSSCEVVIKDDAGEKEMRRELLFPSDQLYSNGNFWRWEAEAGDCKPSSEEIDLEESSGESDESYSDSEDVDCE
ncbi:hypothetical protein FRC05_002279 [Tulasnella sp. 425]|nr:hypothetical protein FRC05_002279 [Tulasnella sp. 425]